ncbi:MAG: hypothetical protein ACJ8C4_16235, partial [Gemmataceae bacterium]
ILLGSVGFAPLSNQVFSLIRVDGANPVVGTFDGLPEGAVVTFGGVPFTISYVGGDGNDVTLKARTILLGIDIDDGTNLAIGDVLPV